MTDFETRPAGTADLVKRLRSYQEFEQNRDGQIVCVESEIANEAADRIEQLVATVEQLEAALTRANAAAAAAYEVAAKHLETHAVQSVNPSAVPTPIGDTGWSHDGMKYAKQIRALATPDQTAALDAVRAEARAQGMREAAEICQTLGPLGGVTPNPRAEWKTHADNLAHAILAAIKGAKA